MPSLLHATWLLSDHHPFSGELFLWAEEINFSAALSPKEPNGSKRPDTVAERLDTDRADKQRAANRQRSDPVRGERKPRLTQIPSHPGQMTLSQLRSYLPQQFPGLHLDETQLTSAVVWLPSHNGAPVARRGAFTQPFALQEQPSATITPSITSPIASPSSVVGGAAQTPNLPADVQNAAHQPDRLMADDTQIHLAPWQITGLTLPARVSLVLLSQFMEESTLHGAGPNGSTRPRDQRQIYHQLRPGPDLIYWSHAAKFALELLIGQHYVPGLYADEAGHFSALWLPTLNDPELVARFDQLVAQMPPICRAYNLDAPAQALSSKALLEDFTTSVVDVSVRDWSNGGSTPGHPGKNGAPPIVVEAEKMAGLQWLYRLRMAERRLDLPPQPVHQFYQEVHNWLEQLHTTGDANFRILFTLETPDDASTTDLANLRWKLTYSLQARDNLSLLIPARQVWQNKGNVLKINGQRIDQPQERLLAGLGAVSHLFAPIERSLRKVQPEAAYLSTEEAHQFLREVGPLLANSGFGIIFPDWWRSRGRTQLGLHLQLRSPFDQENGQRGQHSSSTDFDAEGHPHATSTSPTIGFGAPIQYSWELSIGGKPLSHQEFERLAALQTPLVRIDNRWVELDAIQIESARSFLEKRTQAGSMSFLQALRLTQGWQENIASHQAENAVQPNGSPEQPSMDSLSGRLSAEELPFDLDDPSGSLVLDGVDVDGYLGLIFEQLKQQAPDMMLDEPAGFTGQLRPYQRRGLAWLSYLRSLGLGSCLADDMGLGKTIQAIALHLHTRNAWAAEAGQNGQGLPTSQEVTLGEINPEDAAPPIKAPVLRRPTLLICPTSVMANWRHEIERFAPGLQALVHHGNGRLAGDEFVQAIQQHDFIITSYGTARRDIDLLLQHVWDDVILDEAQNIKNPGAKQTQAVRRLQAHNRVALTGTPVENHLSELWSIIHFLNPGYLGNFESFRKRYIVPIERYNDGERATQLRRLIQPILLRRLKSDPAIISDLPEKNEMVVYCSLSSEQRQLYSQVVQQSLDNIAQSNGIQRRGLVLGLITKLKQICNHPAHYLKTGTNGLDPAKMRRQSGKVSRLHDMLEEALAAGDQALIFTQFVEMGSLLQHYLSTALGVEILFLHGGTPARQRERMVQHFQSEEGPPIFILSLRAGGFGLNLTRANRVFHFDRWWNPAIENQATDRAFRIGQRRDVQVHKFVTAGTLEERINEMIENKLQMAEQIMGSGEEWLTEMDTDELRSLLLFSE